MPAGLQAFDASGNVLIDITQRIGKILGTLNIGASFTGASMTGTVTDSRFTAYTGCVPWCGVLSSSFWDIQEHPQITFSGNVMTWTFPTGSHRPDTKIVYGIY